MLRLYAAAGLVALLVASHGAAWWIGRDHGRLQAEARAAAALVAEQARQARANAAAAAQAADRVRTIEAERIRLQSELDRLSDEADRDPDRDRCAVSADGVRRIGAIRRTAPAGPAAAVPDGSLPAAR